MKYLVSIGVKGLYISGTTGEVFNLSLQEKLLLIQAYKEALDKLPKEQKLLTMVLVSSTVVKEVIELTKKVEELGFDCVALLPPIYYTVTTKNELINYLKLVAEAAPNTPLLYYHSPLKTGELKCEFCLCQKLCLFLIGSLQLFLKTLFRLLSMKFRSLLRSSSATQIWSATNLVRVILGIK